MNADRARALAERLHHGQRHRDGTALIEHVRRVATAVPDDARVVAWLHEALEHTAIAEEALLADGVSREELRAIRLLTRGLDLRSDDAYLAHVERVARARGPGADLARTVKRADLTDRARHALGDDAEWSPPYAVGLGLLQGAGVARLRGRAPGEGPIAHDRSASAASDRESVLPRTEPEFHAERLGFALRGLAAELVAERRKVAELRREIAELRALLGARGGSRG